MGWLVLGFAALSILGQAVCFVAGYVHGRRSRRSPDGRTLLGRLRLRYASWRFANSQCNDAHSAFGWHKVKDCPVNGCDDTPDDEDYVIEGQQPTPAMIALMKDRA